MSDELLVQQCAPTFAGLKTGNLFCCSYDSAEQLRDEIRSLNRTLGPKGIRVIPMRCSGTRALIYVYRPKQLARDISQDRARHLLTERGYPCASPDGCVVALRNQLRKTGEFPHEIGLFLGYPPEDVDGFIRLGPEKCKCTGLWKVYGD
ncbi:MAG: DUF3793 family protein, partial [Clostridia bacterium]|nr:DUF3793 family protein [Clostridia bacterium]